MSKLKVLFADDEPRMRDLVADFLEMESYEVILAEDGRQALDIFRNTEDISLVILDIMMPHMNGYDVLKAIREESDVPAIMLTAKTGEYDELLGFKVGVDEYIKKPFSPKVLVARVNSLVRRFATSEEKYSAFGVEVDCIHHAVTCDGVPIELTAKEFDLLLMFVKNKNVVLSRQQILESVWDFDFDGDERTVDTHVKKLRAKMGEKGDLIKTVWAVGYKFEE